MHTYWLISQDASRKKNPQSSKPERTIDVPKISTRSSLKQSFKLTDTNHVPTQESPKKLRFAPESSLSICKKSGDSQNTAHICDSIDHRTSHSVMTLSGWCLVGKGSSCPCLVDNCDYCYHTKRIKSEKFILPFKNKSDFIVPEACSFHRSCDKDKQLTSDLEEKLVVYDKLRNMNLSISHSESEPFLTGNRSPYRTD